MNVEDNKDPIKDNGYHNDWKNEKMSCQVHCFF